MPDRAVSRAWQGVSAVSAIVVSLIAAAFWIAPRACEGGLEVYFFLGIAGIVAMLALPFILRSSVSLLVRVFLALGFAIVGAVGWVVGLLAANVQILCRLF